MQLIDGLEPVTRGLLRRAASGAGRSAAISIRASRCAASTCRTAARGGKPRPASSPTPDPVAEYEEILHKTRIARAVLGIAVTVAAILFIDNFDSFSYNVVHLLASRRRRAGRPAQRRPAPAAGAARPATMRSSSVPVPARPEHAPRMMAVLRAAIERRDAGLRRLPRTAGDRRSTRRHGDARAAFDARQNLADHARRHRRLRRACRRRLLRRATTRSAWIPRRFPPRCASTPAAKTASCRASRTATLPVARRSVPSRIGAQRARRADRRELSLDKPAVGMIA